MLRNVHESTVAAVTLALLTLTLGGCSPSSEDEDTTPAESARNVRVMPLETAPVTQYLELAGPILPVRGTDISAQESGTVESIDHDKGARVPQGGAVLTLDRRLLAAELDAAEAALTLRRYHHDKKRQLREAGKISQLEILESESQLADARSRRDIARTRFQRARIEAPYAGIVAERYVEPGELVMPGTPVARVIDPYVLKLEGSLTELDVAWLRPGMAADVKVAGLDAPVAGTVAWVGFEASLKNGKFPVEIHLRNDDLALRSGAIGRARIARTSADAMVVIPRDAVVAGDGIDHVFLVDGDRARRTPVVLGTSQGLMVSVREGLAPGDLLIVRGHRDLRDGGLVKVVERVAYGDGTRPGDPADIGAATAGTRVAGEATR